MRDEPLETLQMLDSLASEAESHTDALVAQYERDLATLERALRAPGPKPAFPHVRSFSRFAFLARVPAALLRRTEEAARRVWTSTGSGKSNLVEGLMRAVAFNADPSSLPFFREAIALTVARDTMTTKRRRWAVAGIAFTALKSGDRETSATLDDLLTHDDLRVRTWAVDAVARTWRTRGEKLTAKAAERLERVAREDPAFVPRFVARTILYAEGREVSTVPPNGVYAFKATFGRASRTVELRSEQTLDQLAWAIVSAFDWDDDHLYAFTLSTEVEDQRVHAVYEGNPLTGEGADEGLLSMPVGALGLPVGHRLTMLYDFGDHNLFEVQLVEVKEKPAARARYPRVAATTGKAPRQYR